MTTASTEIQSQETDRHTQPDAKGGDAETLNVDPELLTKHPLQNTWALWFYKNDKSKSWEENQRFISKFDYVEDFWALFNHIQQASKLPHGCDYSLFKDGIEPMWEDARNKAGGRWTIAIPKQQRAHDLDFFWRETLLCMIGESFGEDSDGVCGAVINIRNKGDKLSMWTGNSHHKASVMKIGQKLKETLNLPPNFVIGYQSHEDTQSKGGSTVRNLYSI